MVTNSRTRELANSRTRELAGESGRTTTRGIQVARSAARWQRAGAATLSGYLNDLGGYLDDLGDAFAVPERDIDLSRSGREEPCVRLPEQRAGCPCTAIRSTTVGDRQSVS
jgi:hypothetical protein